MAGWVWQGPLSGMDIVTYQHEATAFVTISPLQ